jgi:hypothetical protein
MSCFFFWGRGLSKSEHTALQNVVVTSDVAEICIINCFHVVRLVCMPLARDGPVLLFVRHLVLDQSPHWRLLKFLHHQRRPQVDVYLISLGFLLLPK